MGDFEKILNKYIAPVIAVFICWFVWSKYIVKRTDSSAISFNKTIIDPNEEKLKTTITIISAPELQKIINSPYSSLILQVKIDELTDVNYTTEDGSNILIALASSTCRDLSDTNKVEGFVDKLVDRKINLLQSDKRGNTALYYSKRRSRHVDISKIMPNIKIHTTTIGENFDEIDEKFHLFLSEVISRHLNK